MKRLKDHKKIATYILGATILLTTLLSPMFATPVSAADDWILQGDAIETEDGIMLTERVGSNQIGVYSKNTPIDPKCGFSISFDYWMGDVYHRAHGGIQFIMLDQPVPEYGVWDTSTYQNYYVVEFDTYDNYEGDIYIRQKKEKTAIAYVSTEDYPFKSCDEAWHHAEITYANGLLSVTVDGQPAQTDIPCDLYPLTYVGFDAETSSYGSLIHKVKNVNLQATNAAKVYLNPNGGTCEMESFFAVPEMMVQLPEATRENHTFKGWYTEPKGGTKLDGSPYTYMDGQSIYAQWEDNHRTVTFKPNQGTLKKKAKKVLKGEEIASYPIPTRKGYTFQGWYTKKTGGVKITKQYVVKKNVTLYAHWIKNTKKFTIKLYKNGGSCKKTSITVKYNYKFKSLPKATRKGYTFQGWYTKKTGGTRVTASMKMKDIYPTTKLYAHWKKRTSSSASSSTSSSGSGVPNSSVTKPSHLECSICKGSGDCTACGGDGYRHSFTMDNEKLNCYKCNQTGRCGSCNGTGKRY